MKQNEIEGAVKSNEKNDTRQVLDKHLLSDVLHQLNVTRKNFRTYPPGHVQIRQSITKCHALLSDLFELAPKIFFWVAKDKLFIGNTLIEDTARHIQELALSFKKHEIAGITLDSNISVDDLSRFFLLMARDPEEIANLGGFDKVLAESGVQTIKLQFIDYSRFHHTDELEISRRKKPKWPAENATIWPEFISGLLSGSLSSSDRGVPLEHAGRIDPSQLALDLNENRIDPDVALNAYRATISKLLPEAGEPITYSAPKAAEFCKFNLLLHELNPKLKKQFLSVTYNKLNAAAENEAAESVLNVFSEHVVIDMLRQANEEGDEISPSLMKLVYKMTSAHDDMVHQERGLNAAQPKRNPTPLFDTQPLQDIFTRENFEDYVPNDYKKSLDALSGAAGDEIVNGHEAFSISDFHKDLEPSYLDYRIVHILLAFMHRDIKPSEYRKYATRLVDIAYDLLGTGNFSTLLEIVKALFRQYKNSTDPEIQFLAKRAVKKIQDPHFAARAVVSFGKWAQAEDVSAYEFLLFFGSKIVPEMVALYGKGERPEIQSVIFKLLERFPRATCLEAKKRFSDPRPFFVSNMLALVRRMGTENDAVMVKKLMEHHDAGVRRKALEIIIELNDPHGPEIVRKYFGSFDAREKLEVIQLIGTYKIADLVPDLISGISRWSLFKSQYERNEKIITALGKIGDASVIPVLEKLAKSRWSLRPKSLFRLKFSLYQSLHGYEVQQISSLLKIGQMSPDSRIRQICQNLINAN